MDGTEIQQEKKAEKSGIGTHTIVALSAANERVAAARSRVRPAAVRAAADATDDDRRSIASREKIKNNMKNEWKNQQIKTKKKKNRKE